MTELIDSRVRRLYLSLGRLLRVIERMYRLNLSVYDLESTEFYLSCRPTSGNLHGQA
jgi:hypothetical protein